MNYSILKGPILAPGQYKYVSLICDDATTGQIDQVAVIRTDIHEGLNRLVDLDITGTDTEQELFNFFHTFLSTFQAVPGIRIQGRAALIIARLLADPNLSWSFNATLKIGTRSINTESLRVFDVRALGDIQNVNDFVLDLKVGS